MPDIPWYTKLTRGKGYERYWISGDSREVSKKEFDQIKDQTVMVIPEHLVPVLNLIEETCESHAECKVKKVKKKSNQIYQNLSTMPRDLP